MTPDGVQAASVARFCTRRPTLIGWKPSTSLPGSMTSNTRRSASAPIAAGSGDWTRMPSCTSLWFNCSTSGEQVRERRRRRQALEIGAQPLVARRLQLAAHVDLRRRIVADEHDAEPRRTAGARRERGHRRADLGADLLRRPPCRRARAPPSSALGLAACASRRLSDSGRPSTTSLSPASHAASPDRG